ncbi:MAG: ribosome biogenesis GTPase Der [Dehalococcoidia bacterium]|nr:ribosome biogenesis GTPase Der [Dehalococcoidia bacterium]
MSPVVAIVGRPNVGKSTLFNRLVGKRIAIVSDVPGTTRDRIFASTTINDRPITLVDTGGLELTPSGPLAAKVRSQAQLAIKEADVVIFLLDVTHGLIPADIEIAEELRRSNKPVIVTVNKVDNERLETNTGEFYRLGIEPVVPVSALHGRGITTLKEALASLLPKTNDICAPTTAEIPRLAIVGRPGVGKSTLLNAILGEERVVVSETPGTTRDAIDTIFHYMGQDILLIDTGGLRRRGRVKSGIEDYSVVRTLRAIDRCHVALLVVDASAPVTAQDTHVAQYILEAYKSVVIVANKWDLVPAEAKEEYRAVIGKRLRFLNFAPLLFTSAVTGAGTGEVLENALDVWRQRNIVLPNEVVGDIICKSYAEHPPLRRGWNRLEIYGARQESASPPKFIIDVNEPKLVHFSYRRYLEKNIRRVCAFSGTPLVMVFRKTLPKGVRQV